MKKIIPYIVGAAVGAGLAISMGAVATAAKPKPVAITSGGNGVFILYDDGKTYYSVKGAPWKLLLEPPEVE